MSSVRPDVNVIGVTGGVNTFRTDAGTTDGYAGEPFKFGGALTTGAAASNYAALCATGDPAIGTDQFAGIAQDDTTHTASADGVVNIIRPIPHVTRLRAKATTTTNIDTDAELLLLLHDAVTFTLTSGTYSIDEDDGANTGGLLIMDGDTAKGTLDVEVDARAMRISVS